MANIETLLNKNDETIYPVTKIEAVYNAAGTETLNNTLDKKANISTASADTNKMMKANGTKSLVTSSNIDFTTFNQIQSEAASGNLERFHYKSENGLAITFRRAKVTGINCTTALGSCYYGFINEELYFYSSQVFIEPPVVSVTIGNGSDATNNFYWIMKANGNNITSATIPAKTYAICSPTSVSGLTAYLDIIAIGKWK